MAHLPGAHPTRRGLLKCLSSNRVVSASPWSAPRVPAAYGGFETAIEEIGQRLAARGHDVTVYCRSANRARPRTHLGMTLVHLPALKTKSIETLSHTALSAIHLAIGKRQDAAFVFNAANAPFVPLIRSRGTATAVHVDGLEWKRGKWGRMGKRYYAWPSRWP
ncbi:hypothetical protein BC477_17230 [Clavibacter michiganensis subsp. michiganensis]|uniref:Glycosyltransferase subfamily 4-like N-terminal domain-containing protein n=1 Tax=Clavibacter michiganensis subsp. michiganensis TaxID=33013 RepID=A0A251XE85_CLAMM|nr:hypothetical protein BC477_17230 [Clavibacter michiganensis subsp. michiganensis]OUE00350.1 hypothetical protein CMMCAS07_18270 [Clavibacter michiganensis subsp. michiganensis]